MGSTTSKVARTASGTARKYPSRIPPQTSPSRTTNASSSPRAAQTSTGPTVHPETQASGSKDDTITRDASDPDLAFNARLAQLGPVQPSPTFSNSSTFNTSARLSPSTPRSQSHAQSQIQHQLNPGMSANSFQPSVSAPSQTIFPSPASNPAVMLLTARSQLARDAEEEFENLGRRDSPGRSFLDVITLRQVLMMRDEQGKSAAEIEETLGLKKGSVGKLGPKRLYSGAGA